MRRLWIPTLFFALFHSIPRHLTIASEYCGIRGMPNPYTARAYRNSNRKSYAITFRHPGQMEHGRPGKKTCKGLGTEDPEEAARLEVELNELLAREDLHSLASRPMAERIFDARIIEIFYSALDPAPTSHRAL